jgi:hypothetical protein
VALLELALLELALLEWAPLEWAPLEWALPDTALGPAEPVLPACELLPWALLPPLGFGGKIS